MSVPLSPTRDQLKRASLGLDLQTGQPGLAPAEAVAVIYKQNGLAETLSILSMLAHDDRSANQSQEQDGLNALLEHLRTVFPELGKALDSSDFFTMEGKRVAIPIRLVPLALVGLIKREEIAACIGQTGPLDSWPALQTDDFKARLAAFHSRSSNHWEAPALTAWLNQHGNDHPKTKARAEAIEAIKTFASQTLAQSQKAKPRPQRKDAHDPMLQKAQPAKVKKAKEPLKNEAGWEWMDVPRIAFALVFFGALGYGATLLDYEAMWNDFHYTWHDLTAAQDTPYVPPLDLALTPLSGEKARTATSQAQAEFNSWMKQEWLHD